MARKLTIGLFMLFFIGLIAAIFPYADICAHTNNKQQQDACSATEGIPSSMPTATSAPTETPAIGTAVSANNESGATATPAPTASVQTIIENQVLIATPTPPTVVPQAAPATGRAE